MVSTVALGYLVLSHQRETAFVLNLILTIQYRNLALLLFSSLVILFIFLHIKLYYFLLNNLNIMASGIYISVPILVTLHGTQPFLTHRCSLECPGKVLLSWNPKMHLCFHFILS